MSIEDTVKTVTEQLNQRLNQQVARPLSDKELVEIIMTILTDAYKDTPKENHKKLYQQLTLLSRPYALEFSHSPYAIYLKSIKKIKILQATLKEVDKSNNTSIFNIENPQKMEEAVYKHLNVFSDNWNMQNRYPSFIRVFTLVVTGLLIALPFIAIIPLFLLCAVPMGVLLSSSYIIFHLLKRVTGNKLQDAINSVDTDYPLEFAAFKANHIKFTKETYYSTQCENNKQELQKTSIPGFEFTQPDRFKSILEERNKFLSESIYACTDEQWIKPENQAKIDITDIPHLISRINIPVPLTKAIKNDKMFVH